MHRDVLSFVVVTKTDFVITTSHDGHLKFWKKQEQVLEFVKHFRAHLGPIQAVAVSFDGLLLATISSDKSIKVFDVVNFDMINMIKLDYIPLHACWIFSKEQARPLLAVSDQGSNLIRIYDGKAQSAEPLETLDSIHGAPVRLMAFHPHANCVVSIDMKGMVEYWNADTPHDLPSAPYISWEYKSDTSLYEFVKAKVVPSALVISPDGSMFAAYGIQDRKVRVFRFRTGKLIRAYDESLVIAEQTQQQGPERLQLESMEFGRRLALEKELTDAQQGQTMNLAFDESSHFLLYPTILGVKVVSIQTNKVARLIGKGENVRILNIALFQSSSVKKASVSLVCAIRIVFIVLTLQ